MRWALRIFLAMAAIGLAMPHHDPPTRGPNVAPAATVPAEGDCNGTNGNLAVAMCHPDDPNVQAACPDNDYDGDGFAAPDDACLDSF